MNRKNLTSVLTAAAFSFLLSFGGIRCLATAFAIEISLPTLILHSSICALVGCIFFSRPKGGRLLLYGLGLLAIYLWRRTQLIDQSLQLCYRISRLFGSAYGFGWLGRPTGVDSMALPLYLWAGINALICGWCITRRRLASVCVFFSLIPLALCLVLTNTIPTLDGLFCLLLGLILLLLTQSVRQRDREQADRLTRILAGPVALALALLCLLNPQATYNKQQYADRMGDSLLRAVDRLPYVNINADGSVSFSLVRHIPDFVDLQYRGTNSQLSVPVMEVTANSSGILYLRGRDYVTYTGTQWNASQGQNETFTNLHANTVNQYGIKPRDMGTLTVKTAGARSSRYLPYYPNKSYPLQNGTCNNPGGETVYSYNRYALPEGFESAVPQQRNYWSQTYDIYLQLPADTKDWAEAYLRNHLPIDPDQAGICDLANAIATLVRDSAAYDLDTGRMPDDTRDFARWFLEDSDTGYCVHFATATTVLLRAAGIPSRYVEGYLAETVAGETVTVTERDAHAWAEYYIAGIGWIPLESTAANIGTGPAPLRPTEQTTSAPTEESTAAPTVTEPPSDPGTTATTPPQVTESPTQVTPGISGNDPVAPSDPAQIMPGEEKNFTVSKSVLISLGILLLLLAQYPIRLYLQEKHLQSGDANSRGLKNWHFVCRLARLAGQTPPEELHELALRAKFSPYTLTEEELARFGAFRRQTVSQLRRRPWWQQVYHKLFWAAY